MYSDRPPSRRDRDEDDYDARDGSSRRGGVRAGSRGRGGREYVRGGGGRGRATFNTRGASVSGSRVRPRPERPEKTEHKFRYGNFT